MYQIPLSCIGVLPKIELHGPWEENTNSDNLGELKEGDEEGGDAGEETEDTGPVIDFDRLLLKHREAREFSINNTMLRVSDFFHEHFLIIDYLLS